MLKNDVYKQLFTDWRIERYTAELLNSKDEYLSELGEIVGGTFTTSTDARIKSSAKINMILEKPVAAWSGLRVRLVAHANGVDWPLGIFIPSSPEQRHTPNGVEVSLELLDKLTLLDKDCLDTAFSIPARTVLSDFLVEFTKSIGDDKVKIDGAPSMNRHPMTWDAGTSKLTVINDVLDYMGFFSLQADRYGYYVASKYLIPAERPISWLFTEGEQAMFAPEFTHTWDLDAIPNKIVYIAQTTGTLTLTTRNEHGDPTQVEVEAKSTTPAMVAVATNEDPKSMFSYQSRGRWIVEVGTDIKAETQEILQRKAELRLRNAMEPMEKIEIHHALIPVQLNEIARFKTSDYDIIASIRKYEITLTPGELMYIKLRKVNYADNQPGSSSTE